jgi:hypothetical protein
LATLIKVPEKAPNVFFIFLCMSVIWDWHINILLYVAVSGLGLFLTEFNNRAQLPQYSANTMSSKSNASHYVQYGMYCRYVSPSHALEVSYNWRK